eukprot:scaffold4067_cov206-Chaetoceros_neogracile.AAC.2
MVESFLTPGSHFDIKKIQDDLQNFIQHSHATTGSDMRQSAVIHQSSVKISQQSVLRTTTTHHHEE